MCLSVFDKFKRYAVGVVWEGELTLNTLYANGLMALHIYFHDTLLC